MSELIILLGACILTGFMVYDSTYITIDAEEITKLNSYCKANQGVAKVRYTTDGKRKVTCVDGAIFEMKGEK